MLAYAFGGEVGYNPRGQECGTVEVGLDENAQEDRLLGGLGPSIQVHVCHEQSVLRLPENAQHLASSTGDPNQAFLIEDCAWGVQFHPEFDAEIVIAYIQRASEEIQAKGQEPDHLIATCHDTPYGPQILRRFARIAARNM